MKTKRAMKKVYQKHNETRKDYLFRVAMEMLRDNAYSIDMIEYDDANCDAYCLVEDMEICLEYESE